MDNPFKNNEIKKIKKTNSLLYGCDYVFWNDLIKEKIKQTNIKLYGTISPIQSDIVKNKMINSWKELSNKWTKSTHKAVQSYNLKWKKYGVEITFDNWDYCYCNKCQTKNSLYNNILYNRIILWNLTPCTNCLPIMPNVSLVETNFYNFITKIYKGNVKQSNRKVLWGKEIDIYLPELKIGIEINGLYWHSDEYKWKNDHYDKMKLCEDKGIQLFQFCEDEVLQGMMLIYSILKNKGVLKNDINIEELNNEFWLQILKELKDKYYARNLTIKTLTTQFSNEMLEMYHIQWKDIAKHKYALIDNEWNIISLMTLKKMSIDKNQQISNNKGTYELSRYVTLPGIQIIWGFNKKIDIPNATIITYSNLRYSSEESNVYIRNWFEKLGFTGINYYYFFNGKKYHRFNFRKDKLYNEILPKHNITVSDNYKEESEQWMIQKLNEVKYIHKVYDAGHIKWILT